jgi:two-component system NtrC family sensor kinase
LLLVLILASSVKFETSYREGGRHLELVRHEQSIDGTRRLCNVALLKRYTFAQVSNEACWSRLANLQTIYGSVFVDLGVVDEQGIQVAYAGPFKLEGHSKAFGSMTPCCPTITSAMSSSGFVSSPTSLFRPTEAGGKTWIVRAPLIFWPSYPGGERQIGKTGSAFILNRAGEFGSFQSSSAGETLSGLLAKGQEESFALTARGHMMLSKRSAVQERPGMRTRTSST